ncbi:conserved hypothetical protein [Luminiphilus syltensis NOR5-1B]|uniref:Methyltransferase type 11 domain-containing protein n=1 Tax=Luminiphilus syltensis NOR5-1B TaxID=565045 RepID=B8KYL8_9GAMM|nr:class I SAM-dependent methyltransferase [Luminiphilus syltensis]EED35420.1 conserved hypothetical protein [Luminiphilus syltensis NOR5-1B]
MAAPVQLRVTLRGGHRLALDLAPDDPELRWLREQRAQIVSPEPTTATPLLQLPLDDGREALTVSSVDVIDLQFVNPEHPAMNIREGHLGGYISARHPDAHQLSIENGDPLTWSPTLWRWIVEELGVTSVLDVGCGEGHAAGFFLELGCDVQGVDGSAEALRDSAIPKNHVRHDFTAGPYHPLRRFDMVWSCEFVEHVEERYCENFLATFATAEQYIFMTAAPPGQPGWHHVNCQPSSYWVSKVEQRGFALSQHLTDRARAMVEPGHFAHTGLVFKRCAP